MVAGFVAAILTSGDDDWERPGLWYLVASRQSSAQWAVTPDRRLREGVYPIEDSRSHSYTGNDSPDP